MLWVLASAESREIIKFCFKF
jgi:hypothetical protein